VPPRLDLRRSVALVGEKKWEKRNGHFLQTFTKAHVHYFDLNQIEEARDWLESEPVHAK
jgi:hypothetical protein